MGTVVSSVVVSVVGGGQSVGVGVGEGSGVLVGDGSGLSVGLDDRGGLVRPDDGLGWDDALGYTVGKDRGHNVGLAVHNSRALVGHGSGHMGHMITDLGHVGLFNDRNAGMHLGVGVSRDDLLPVGGQGKGVSTGVSRGSSSNGSKSKQHHLCTGRRGEIRYERVF